MQNYFVKATYNGNIYKISDFYNSDGSFKIDLNKMLEFDMHYNDGISVAISQKLLPDNTEPVDYTHIIVPAQNKIYRIAGVEWYNFDARIITLSEDPLIGNWNTLKDTKISLSRTNDSNLFQGVHDLNNTREMSLAEPLQNFNNFGGKIALLYFTMDTPHISMRFKKLGEETLLHNGNEFDYFDSMTELLDKFPNRTGIKNDNILPYLEKFANVNVGGPTRLFQFVRISYNRTTKVSEWAWKDYYTELFPNTVDQPYEGGILLEFPEEGSGTYSRLGDIPYRVIGLPISVNNGFFDPAAEPAGGLKQMLSFSWFDTVLTSEHLGKTTGPENLVDIKIVDASMISRDWQNQVQSGARMNHALDVNVYKGLYPNDNWCVYGISRLATDYDVSFEGTSDPMQSSPFKERYLSIYGNHVKISNYYHDKEIKVRIIPSMTNFNYIVFNDKLQNVIASGSFTTQAVWSKDSFSAWIQSNPSYKEIFNNEQAFKRQSTIISRNASRASLLTDATSGAIGGAIGGAVAGPGAMAGAMAGAGASLITGVINQAIQENAINKQLDLDKRYGIQSQKIAERDAETQPDQIYGNSAELSMLIDNYFGIVLFEISNQTNGTKFMENELSWSGFPTSGVKKYTELAGTMHPFFETAVVLIKGIIYNNIKNSFTTNEINKKLESGIIIVP